MLRSRFFLLQFLPAHLVFLASILLIEKITIPMLISWFLLWVIVGGFGIEVGFHRAISHNHFQLSERTKKILGIIGMFGMNGAPMSWRAMHVVHHRFADTENDLHSPIHGFVQSYLSYTWKVEQESKSGNLAFRLAVKQMMKDPFWVFLDKWVHIIVFTTLVLSLIISPTIAFVISATMIACYNQTAFVNVFAHGTNGKRSHDTKDHSLNRPILGYFTFGLSLHNNHHFNPGNPNFGEDRYLDIGYVFGKMVKFLDEKFSLR
jgi:stearoyl-CoA desaturase (delta-9 desaturase)